MNLKEIILLVCPHFKSRSSLVKIYVKNTFYHELKVWGFSWFKFVFIEKLWSRLGYLNKWFFTYSEENWQVILTRILDFLRLLGEAIALLDTQYVKIIGNDFSYCYLLIFAGAIRQLFIALFFMLKLFLLKVSYGGPCSNDVFSWALREVFFMVKSLRHVHFPFIENAICPIAVPYFGGKTFKFFLRPRFLILLIGHKYGGSILFSFNKKAFAKVLKDRGFNDVDFLGEIQ